MPDGQLAARISDKVAHTNAASGMGWGAMIGAGVGIALMGVAVVATGGLAAAPLGVLIAGGAGAIGLTAGGAVAGGNIGEVYPGPRCGQVVPGETPMNVRIEGEFAARQGVDRVNHGPKPTPIAEGSKTVFVNDRPLARIRDRIQCKGLLVETCKHTFVGGEPSGDEVESEVPSWLRYVGLGAGAVAIVALLPVMGAAATFAMAGVGIVGSFGGGLIGQYVGRQIGGGGVSGERAARWGAAIGEFGGGMLATAKVGALRVGGGTKAPGGKLQDVVTGRPAPRANAAPHDPAELYAIKREGFYGWDPERGLSRESLTFGKRMHASVENVRERVQSGELKTAREAMDALAQHRAKIASDIGDPRAADFGAPRDTPELIDGQAMTGFRGKYRYVMERYAAEPPPPKVEVIDGQEIPLTRLDNGAMEHVHGRNIAPLMSRAEVLYARAMDPSASVAETTAAVGELHYVLSHAMPYARGSAAIGDALTKVIFGARGIQISPWKEGIAPDLEAFLTPSRQHFVDNYGAMMDRPPTAGPSFSGSPSAPAKSPAVPACSTCVQATQSGAASGVVADAVRAGFTEDPKQANDAPFAAGAFADRNGVRLAQ